MNFWWLFVTQKPRGTSKTTYVAFWWPLWRRVWGVFIILLYNSACFQAGKKQKMSKNTQKCPKLPKLNFSWTRPKAFLRQFFCTKCSFWPKEMFLLISSQKNTFWRTSSIFGTRMLKPPNSPKSWFLALVQGRLKGHQNATHVVFGVRSF